jgi:hypothetical protein
MNARVDVTTLRTVGQRPAGQACRPDLTALENEGACRLLPAERQSSGRDTTVVARARS